MPEAYRDMPVACLEHDKARLLPSHSCADPCLARHPPTCLYARYQACLVQGAEPLAVCAPGLPADAGHCSNRTAFRLAKDDMHHGLCADIANRRIARLADTPKRLATARVLRARHRALLAMTRHPATKARAS